jgi:hypothetical protein
MVVLGIGSSGIVLSNPRIPISNEIFSEIIELNQVSKILFINDNYNNYIPCNINDYHLEYTNIKKLSEDYGHIFNNNYFLLPIIGGIIDKKKFIEEFNKKDILNYKWLSSSKYYFNILNNLIINKKDLYQIIYEKGDKISNNITDFLNKISNIKNILKIANTENFFFDDIKLENLIYHNNLIKMIDFSAPINLNLPYENIIEQINDSKLNCIFYYAYNIIYNVVLYEQIDNIKTIGYLDKKKNYYLLLLTQSFEYEQLVKYKIQVIKNLYDIYNKYIPDYNIKIKVFNYNFIDKINSSNIETLLEERIITMEDFTYSNLRILLYDTDNLKERTYNNNMTNKIILFYKNFIDKLFINDQTQKIIFLLKNINIYSFGFIFINWLNSNIKNMIETNNLENLQLKLKNIFNIILYCCTNIITIDSIIYFTYPNYDFNILS